MAQSMYAPNLRRPQRSADGASLRSCSGAYACTSARIAKTVENSALRAICFLISAMATRGLFTRRQGKPWYQDPFTFRAFKLGVARLLDALEPPGEISIPIHEQGTRFAGSPVYSTLIKTPEDAAVFAAEGELLRLFHIGPEIFTQHSDTEPLPIRGRLVEWNEDYERGLYALSDARRDLGIDEPKKRKS